jgi:hypothetical protein
VKPRACEHVPSPTPLRPSQPPAGLGFPESRAGSGLDESVRVNPLNEDLLSRARTRISRCSQPASLSAVRRALPLRCRAAPEPSSRVKARLRRRRDSALQAAQSGAVGAGSKMPLRPGMQGWAGRRVELSRATGPRLKRSRAPGCCFCVSKRSSGVVVGEALLRRLCASRERPSPVAKGEVRARFGRAIACSPKERSA